MKPRMEIGGAGSIVKKVRSLGLTIDGLPQQLPATTITEAYRAVPLEPDFGLERPLVWIRPDSGDVVVDGAVVTGLTRVDGTKKPEDDLEILSFLPGVWDCIDPQALVTFLLQSEVITTYWHVGATIERVSESHTAGAYRARWVGEHEYFTNERNVEDLDFAVTVSPEGAYLSRPR